MNEILKKLIDIVIEDVCCNCGVAKELEEETNYNGESIESRENLINQLKELKEQIK